MTTERASGSLARRTGAARSAFTLIELLVVIIIIGIIISIVLPALSGARRAARTVATRAMLTDITNAASSFGNDHQGKMPGYFNAREMGHADNATRGFPEMTNAMLDLAGMPGTGATNIGPTNANTLGVDPSLFGVADPNGGKQYWVPDGKFLALQNETGQQVAAPENLLLPSVVDHFRNPILAWRADETLIGQITTVDQFAGVNAPTGSNAPSRFYWNSNAAFLQASSLGPRAADQTTLSMLRAGAPVQERRQSLAGILGHPSYPVKDGAGKPVNPGVPASARGPFVVHSAGADNVYFSIKDRGAKQFPNPAGPIDYLVNFFPPGTTTPYTDKDGKNTSIDIIEKFDDVLSVGGN
jgi:prepilin-type N-terminal cleavage/methylation domain-containing protein